MILINIVKKKSIQFNQKKNLIIISLFLLFFPLINEGMPKFIIIQSFNMFF
jgi:hypothetical protein